MQKLFLLFALMLVDNSLHAQTTSTKIRDTIVINQKFDYLCVNENGKLIAVVVNNDGSATETEVNPYKSPNQCLITDGKGDSLVIDNNGRPMGTSENRATGRNSALLNDYHRKKDSAAVWCVNFDKYDDQKFGFDKYSANKSVNTDSLSFYVEKNVSHIVGFVPSDPDNCYKKFGFDDATMKPCQDSKDYDTLVINGKTYHKPWLFLTKGAKAELKLTLSDNSLISIDSAWNFGNRYILTCDRGITINGKDTISIARENLNSTFVIASNVENGSVYAHYLTNGQKYLAGALQVESGDYINAGKIKIIRGKKNGESSYYDVGADIIDSINSYFVQAGVKGGSFPPSKGSNIRWIVVNFSKGNLIAHEIGHTLGLPHTFDSLKSSYDPDLNYLKRRKLLAIHKTKNIMDYIDTPLVDGRRYDGRRYFFKYQIEHIRKSLNYLKAKR